MYDAGTPQPVFPMRFENLEGWDWERGGRGVNGRGQMYTCGQFMIMFGKNHHKYSKGIVLQLKKLKCS